MTIAAVSPVPRLTFFANDGAPLAGGLLYTYAAGTTTPKKTYSDTGLTVEISNPIVMNAAGRPQASATDATEVNVYLLPASYKFVLTTSLGTTLWTADNVPADGTTTIVFPVAVNGGTSGAIPYFSSTTTLSVSALLGANALMLGGGAGTAPFTDSSWVIEQAGKTLSSSTQPRCTVTNSAAATITTGVETALTFNTNIDAIPATIHNTSSNTSRLVVPAAAGGFYTMTAGTFFAANATGKRYIYFRKNGTTGLGPITIIPSNAAGNGTGIVVTCYATLVAADYVEAMVFQDSGGDLAAGSSSGVGAGGASWASLVKLW